MAHGTHADAAGTAETVHRSAGNTAEADQAANGTAEGRNAPDRAKMLELKEKTERGTSGKVKLLKPTLQKFGDTDNIEHFSATFESIAKQHSWPKDLWATQLVG